MSTAVLYNILKVLLRESNKDNNNKKRITGITIHDIFSFTTNMFRGNIHNGI